MAIAGAICHLTHAASPQLLSIIPPGVERGKEQVLTFKGNRLDDVEQVLFYSSGLTAKEVTAADAKTVRVTVEVADDCRLGVHLAQLRTRSGLSDFRSFSVGVLPTVDEKEPNNAIDATQAIEPDICIAGTLENEDIDCFRIDARQGQRITAEVEGIRLGQAFFDPHLSVLDPSGKELAVCDDTILAKQDPFVSVIAAEDGPYTIVLRDAAFRGSAACRYRLHIGSFPRPLVAYPAGGKRGEPTRVQLLGDPGGVIEHEIIVPPDAAPDHLLRIDDNHAPSALPFRTSDESNVLETEPNNDFERATPAEVPFALNGRIDAPGDVDLFKLSAKKGQVWEVECYAQRIGSPLDPVINVYNGAKKSLAGNDDSRKQDPYLRWEVPEDGDYYIRIRDHLNRGGETFVYRVELSPPAPSLKIGIPRVARYSQDRQWVVVPRGNRYGTVILATRSGFSGPVELVENDLLPGLSMSARPMHPSLNQMPVVFEATGDAPLDGALVDLRARLADAKEGQAPVEGAYENIADFVRGEPNNAIYVTGTVDRLAVAVSEEVPYHIEIVEPKVPLVRQGTMRVKVLVHRAEGFDKPLQLKWPFSPPGVGATGTVTVEAGKSEASYPLNANSKAMLGKWPVMVIGAADVGGQAWVSSQLAELEIAEPFVTFEATRATCEQGATALINCTIAHARAFDEPATAELLGLPPGTSAEKVEFTSETENLTFQIETTDKTPIGKHPGLLVRTTIRQHGEPIVSTAATTELRVTAPASDDASPPKKETPPTKPLSRLEQLRAKYRPDQQK